MQLKQEVMDEVRKLLEFKEFLIADIKLLQHEQEKCKEAIIDQQEKQRDQSEKAKKLQASLDEVLNEHFEPTTVGAFQQNYLRQ